MTLILQRPTGSKLTLRQTYIGTDDPDAAAYIAAVEAADEIASPGIGGLETATKVAIHSFVKGCKNDGIWPAIKASCILAGAKTTRGALVPLVGTAPDPYNFDLVGDTDYNRKTGLKGDGSTKYLDSNRAADADPQNNNHISCYIVDLPTVGNSYIGTSQSPQTNIGTNFGRSRSNIVASAVPVNGFIGISRSSSDFYVFRYNGANAVPAISSASPGSGSYGVFVRLNLGAPSSHSNVRLAFYSIGESLPDGLTKTGLQLLDERVSALINAFGVAIP